MENKTSRSRRRENECMCAQCAPAGSRERRLLKRKGRRQIRQSERREVAEAVSDET